jgi:hypothetical protein
MIKKRLKYGELSISSINPLTMKIITNLINSVTASAKVDEHRGWKFGVNSNGRGQVSALNWDLYDYGRDYYNKTTLIVIQIRQFERRKVNYFSQIRKNYFLIGKNEDNSIFAHCIEGRVIHNAIKRKKDVIHAVQSWIFENDYKKVNRQGDIGLVQVKTPLGNDTELTKVVLENSHEISAEKIFLKGEYYYVLNPKVVHYQNVHPTLDMQGWYKVVVGRRSDFWMFAAPTVD